MGFIYFFILLNEYFVYFYLEYDKLMIFFFLGRETELKTLK